MAKLSRKKQGNQVDASAMSSANIIKDPEHLGRGLGTAYAYAVDNLKAQAEEIKANKGSFLGVEKKQIDPYENMHSSLLPKNFNPGDKA
jgi:hypothetical protein